MFLGIDLNMYSAYVSLFARHAWNNANLVEILESPVPVIEYHVVHSFLVTLITASIPFVCHHTRVVPGSVWPIANDTLTRSDVRVTRQLPVNYHCGAVNFV